MFVTYLVRELRRRKRQACFIALGLAVGIGLVITVTAASAGVKNAQSTVLHSLYGVGTDITVTTAPSRARAARSGSGSGAGRRRRGPAQGRPEVQPRRAGDRRAGHAEVLVGDPDRADPERHRGGRRAVGHRPVDLRARSRRAPRRWRPRRRWRFWRGRRRGPGLDSRRARSRVLGVDLAAGPGRPAQLGQDRVGPDVHRRRGQLRRRAGRRELRPAAQAGGRLEDHGRLGHLHRDRDRRRAAGRHHHRRVHPAGAGRRAWPG